MFKRTSLALLLALAASLTAAHVATAAGRDAELVKRISPRTLASSPSTCVTVGEVCFFSASAGATIGEELWKTDGTAAGTRFVKDINPVPGKGSSITEIVAVGPVAYFVAENGQTGFDIWKSDGTAAGTARVSAFALTTSSYLSELTVIGTTVFFVARTLALDSELWKVETASDTVALVRDIRPGRQAGRPRAADRRRLDGRLRRG